MRTIKRKLEKCKCPECGMVVTAKNFCHHLFSIIQVDSGFEFDFVKGDVLLEGPDVENK